MTASAPPSPHDGSHGATGPGPRHVAIIMDGNGRWAQARGLPRVEGHRVGLEALRATVRAAADLGIAYLTLYSFSTENWRRPAQEVGFLMGLLKRFVRNDLAELHAAGVRVRVIGDRFTVPPDIRELLIQSEELTAGNCGLTLVIAFNYGSRDEFVRVARQLAREVAAGRLKPDAIDEAAIEARLDTAGIPDPDLVIRTSGEERISNFLLWQSAYAEFVFPSVLWPEFDRAHLLAACEDFRKRQRRFGGIGPVEALPMVVGRAAP